MTRLAQRAVEVGKDDAIALAAAGWALAHIVRDLELGAALIDRALGLNSNLAEAWFYGGWAKNWLGEPEAAIERFARAMRLSPLDPWLMGMRAGTAHAHFFLGRYDGAASWAAMALQGQSGLSTRVTYGRRKQRNGRTAGASTQGSGSAAATQSRATCLQSQRRAGPLAPRRPLAIQRRVAASRVARVKIAAEVHGTSDFCFWPKCDVPTGSGHVR